MKRTIDTVTREKISFIDENSYILNNVLWTRLTNDYSVLEVVIGVILSNKPLNECTHIEKLESLLDTVKNLYMPNQCDAFDSLGVIFNVANYINSTISDEKVREGIKDRLRIYTSSFKSSGDFSKRNGEYVRVDKKAPVLMKK